MTPSDAQARRDGIHERERNVLVDAGAGTGKTTLLVERLVQMVAPDDDGPAPPLERIAAVTFTRRAAGELRLRIRERLLQGLAQEGSSPRRRTRLYDALGSLDAAHVGHIRRHVCQHPQSEDPQGGREISMGSCRRRSTDLFRSLSISPGPGGEVWETLS